MRLIFSWAVLHSGSSNPQLIMLKYLYQHSLSFFYAMHMAVSDYVQNAKRTKFPRFDVPKYSIHINRSPRSRFLDRRAVDLVITAKSIFRSPRSRFCRSILSNLYPDKKCLGAVPTPDSRKAPSGCDGRFRWAWCQWSRGDSHHVFASFVPRSIVVRFPCLADVPRWSCWSRQNIFGPLKGLSP
jgi:hypothetical protein